MAIDEGLTDTDDLVIALTPAQLGIVLAVLVALFLAIRMRRAR